MRELFAQLWLVAWIAPTFASELVLGDRIVATGLLCNMKCFETCLGTFRALFLRVWLLGFSCRENGEVCSQLVCLL